jgi:hypothetical protein
LRVGTLLVLHLSPESWTFMLPWNIFLFIILKKFIFNMEGATAATYNADMFEGSKGDNRSVSSSCKLLKTSDKAWLSTVAKETTPTLEDIPSELFIQYILPFVGDHQYRFVAAVNRNFHTAYVAAFPIKETRFNVSTIEHAKICFDENKGDFYDKGMLCDIAAREGNLTVLKYLRSIQCPWDTATCAFAAINGHLDVIKWCRQNGCPWNSDTCSNAAENGHLDIIKWCRENGCDWDRFTCPNAAENGHLDVVKWCRQNGCEWNAWTCAMAAENGHLDVIQWCRQNGCPWDDYTCAYAAQNGHLEVLQWCCENGCPWNYRTCLYAAKNGHINVLKWCRQNGFPWDNAKEFRKWMHMQSML